MAAEREVVARGGVASALWAARGIDGAIWTPETAVFRARRRGRGAGNRPDKRAGAGANHGASCIAAKCLTGRGADAGADQRAGASTLFLCRFTTR